LTENQLYDIVLSAIFQVTRGASYHHLVNFNVSKCEMAHWLGTTGIDKLHSAAFWSCQKWTIVRYPKFSDHRWLETNPNFAKFDVAIMQLKLLQ